METITYTCGDMTIALAQSVLDAMAEDLPPDTRAFLAAHQPGDRVELPVIHFDVLLEAVAKHERGMFGEERADG